MMFLHNVFSHPLMAILQLLGFERAALVAHNVTLPRDPDIDPDAIAAVIEISPDNIAIGMMFSELLALSDGKAMINRHEERSPDTGSTIRHWTVSHWCSGEWRQDTGPTLSEALEVSLDRQIDRLTS